MADRKAARTARIAVPVLIALAFVFPVGIAAHTNEQIAKTGGMTATLPFFPTSLTVQVQLDVVGNISAVNLDPAGLPQTAADDHRVKFASADGTVKVDVKAKGDKLSIKAKASTLAGLQGVGSWSGDVFGTGTVSTVPYTVGNAAGKPTLTLGTPSGLPAGATATVSPVKTDKDGTKATASVPFVLDGFTKKLTISVAVNKDGKASLKITLSGKDKQKLSGQLATLLGDRTWSAHLCDGTPVSVSYRIGEPGVVTFISSNPAGAKVKTEKDGFKASFDGTKVRVSVKLKQGKDGAWTLKVDGKSGTKCHDKAPKAEKAEKADSDRKGHS